MAEAHHQEHLEKIQPTSHHSSPIIPADKFYTRRAAKPHTVESTKRLEQLRISSSSSSSHYGLRAARAKQLHVVQGFASKAHAKHKKTRMTTNELVRYFGPIHAIIDEDEKVIALVLKRSGPGAYQLTDNALSSLVSWAVSEFQEQLQDGFCFDFSEVEHLVHPGEFGREDAT